jgi:hypothetical protein
LKGAVSIVALLDQRIARNDSHNKTVPQAA